MSTTTKYRDELYGDRDKNAIRNFKARRGSLGIYDLQELPNKLGEAYGILQQLKQEGRLFVERFDFRKYVNLISQALGEKADYSQVPEAIRDIVKKLHEGLGGEEILKVLDGLGIMSIRTGAPIPTPRPGVEQKDILAMGAHPDDIEIMFGAAMLHQMVVERNIVHYFVVFPGTAGGDDRGYTMLGAPILRLVELIGAARKLGIPWVHIVALPTSDELGFPHFGLEEWFTALHLDNAPDAMKILALALARTLGADEIWSHIKNSLVDWHDDHWVVGFLADIYAAWGQWTSYCNVMVDTRKRIPSSVLRVFGVVWEKLEKLPTTITTKYYRFFKGDKRQTPVASLLEESLRTHESQNGINYAEAKLCKDRSVGIMNDVNNFARPSNEVAYAEGVTRNVEIPLRGVVMRYAKVRLAYLNVFQSITDWILAPVEEQFPELNDDIV